MGSAAHQVIMIGLTNHFLERLWGALRCDTVMRELFKLPNSATK
jgi:hypothetical protein